MDLLMVMQLTICLHSMRLYTMTANNRDFEEFHFLGYNAIQSFESQPTFLRTCHLFLQSQNTCFLLGLFLNPENIGKMLLLNVG
jgi:hypothetical protein